MTPPYPTGPQPLHPEEVERLFRVLAQHFPGDSPAARGPKRQPDPFRTCISCILSAQSRDANTAAATKGLFARAQTPDAIAALDREALIEAIRPAGLYNAKAKSIHAFCAALLEQHGGTVPQTRAELMALPGIGRKCADIVLHFAFAVPTIAVDTHVGRVCRRTGLACGKTEAAIAADLDRRAPDWAKSDGHFWLLALGKRICMSRKPKCEVCPIAAICRSTQI